MTLPDVPARLSLKAFFAAHALQGLRSSSSIVYGEREAASRAARLAASMLKERGTDDTELTLRDYFAAKSLVGLMTREGGTFSSLDLIASLAYEDADALLHVCGPEAGA